MKKILSTLLVAATILLGSNVQAENRYTGEYAGQHFAHYAVGGIAGGLANHYYPDDWNQDYRIPFSIAVPLAIGLVVETIDDGSNGTWDFLDVLEYGAGGAGAVFIMSWEF